MPASLLLLLRLRLVATLRKPFRAGSGKRLVVTIVGAVLVALWMLPSILSAALLPRTDRHPEVILQIGPALLLMLCVLPLLLGSPGNAAIAFSPAEIDLLFPGPFSRRQLLVYKLTAGVGGAMFMALVFSVVFARHAPSWPQALASLLTAMVFTQLVATIAALARTRIAEAAYSKGRRVVLAVVVATVALVVWRAAQDLPGGDPFAVLKRVNQNPVAGAVLAPFRVLIRSFVAEDAVSFLGWLTAGWGMNAVLLLIVLRLDTDFMEASIAISQKLYARVQRVRRGGAWSASLTAESAKRRVPALPHLGGAGPIAWRQLAGAIRGGRRALIALVIGAAAMAFIFNTGHGEGGHAAATVPFALTWLTFMLAATFRFDFRGDLDAMDSLKALPTPALAVAAGQMAVPTVSIGALQVAVLAAAGAMRIFEPPIAAAAAVLAPLATFIWLAADNFVFLLAPSRPPAGALDFQALGRQSVLMLAKAGLLAVAGVAVWLAGWLAYLVSGGSWTAAVGAGGVVVLAVAASMLWAVAWAFARFDPSTDMPA